MTQILLIILGIVIIAVLLLPGRAKEKVVGICQAVMGLDTKKRENKDKILALLGERGSASAFGRTESTSSETKSAQGFGETREVSNSDIREALGVSDRSVIRYMDELEREGKVEQIGNTGRSVIYRLK